MQPKEGGGQRSGETREDVVYRLAADMLDKLPNDYVQHEVGIVEQRLIAGGTKLRITLLCMCAL